MIRIKGCVDFNLKIKKPGLIRASKKGKEVVFDQIITESYLRRMNNL